MFRFPTKEPDIARNQNTFAKLQRERKRKEKAAAKLARRQNKKSGSETELPQQVATNDEANHDGDQPESAEDQSMNEDGRGADN